MIFPLCVFLAVFKGKFFGFFLGAAAVGVAEMAVGGDGKGFLRRESEKAAELFA
jgi:hypothetical protein